MKVAKRHSLIFVKVTLLRNRRLNLSIENSMMTKGNFEKIRANFSHHTDPQFGK